jgi:hypothetical protein
MTLSPPALLFLACGNVDYAIKQKVDDGLNPSEDTGLDTSLLQDTVVVEPLPECPEYSPPEPGEIALNAECERVYTTSSFEPLVEWEAGDQPFCGPPVIGPLMDTNGSGAIDRLDLSFAVIYQQGPVVALWGHSGEELWRTEDVYGADGGPALGDVDGDGWPEIITADDSRVCALAGQSGAELWCTEGLEDSLDRFGYTYPALADLDGDGEIEVVAGSAILRGPTGELLGQGALGKGAAHFDGEADGFTYGAISVPYDLDNDGELEVVTGNAAYRKDGSLLWSNDGLDGLIAIADFDGDGEAEIIKTSGTKVVAMETDGSEVWGPLTWEGNLSAPAADDLDGDGVPEFLFAARDELVAMKWPGMIYWTTSIDDRSGASGPTLFDFDLDGYPEVLYADETSVRFFSGIDGSSRYISSEHESKTILETPIVADIDGDSQVEIVLGHCAAEDSDYTGITVYGDAGGSWPPGRRIWNQHAYSISHIMDHGRIPSPTPNNLSTFNSFRSGDVGMPPTEYIDLSAELLQVCEEECGGGRVLVYARLLNHGNITVQAGVPLSLRAGAGGAILSTLYTAAELGPASASEVLTFEVEAALLAGLDPVVMADEDADSNGIIYECEEGNNAGNWGSAVCSP